MISSPTTKLRKIKSENFFKVCIYQKSSNRYFLRDTFKCCYFVKHFKSKSKHKVEVEFET